MNVREYGVYVCTDVLVFMTLITALVLCAGSQDYVPSVSVLKVSFSGTPDVRAKESAVTSLPNASDI